MQSGESGEARSNDEEHEPVDNQSKDSVNSKTYAVSVGTKQAYPGISYELKISMHFFYCCWKKKRNFKLGIQVLEGGKFDDIKCKYEKDNQWLIRFAQLKYIKDPEKTISASNLLAVKGDFSLPEHFVSYREIEKKFEGTNDRIKDVSFCTNINIGFGDQLGDLKLCQNIFVEESDGFYKNSLRFKEGDFQGKKQIVQALLKTFDLYKLANELCDMLFDDKRINMNESTIKSYEFALLKNGIIDIDGKTKALSKEFLENNETKSSKPEAKLLHETLEKIFDERRDSYNLVADPLIEEQELKHLVEELVKMMKNCKRGKAIEVKDAEEVVKKNLQKLVGWVLVRRDNKTKFSSAFLDAKTILPGNLEDFRGSLLAEVSKTNIVMNDLVFANFADFKTCAEAYVDKAATWKFLEKKQLQLPDDFGKSISKPAPVKTFVEDLALQIKESRSNKKGFVTLKTKNFSKNIDELLHSLVLVEDNGKLRFSDKFLGRTQASRTDCGTYPKTKPKSEGQEEQLLSDWNDFRSKLSIKVKNLDQCRFVIQDGLKLPSDGVADMKRTIEKFLRDWRFVNIEPDNIEFGDRIKVKMSEFGKKNLLKDGILESKLLTYTSEWMREQKGHYLDMDDANKFFGELYETVASSPLTVASVSYCSKIRGMKIRFKDEEMNIISDFLERENKTQLLNLICSLPDIIFESIKVCQFLDDRDKGRDANSSPVEYYFLDANFVLGVQDILEDAFKSPDKKLVLVCENVGKNEEELYKKLSTIIKPMKKIILITQEADHTLAKIFETEFGNKYDSKVMKGNSILDLEDGSRSKILNDGKVNFQGKVVTLGELIDENQELMKLIDAEKLFSLINKKILKIAEELEGVSNYHISRKFHRRVKIHPDFQRERTKFYVAKNLVLDSEDIKDKDIIVISDKIDVYKRLCSDYQKHNIHWLKYIADEFIWEESHGALSELLKFNNKHEEGSEVTLEMLYNFFVRHAGSMSIPWETTSNDDAKNLNDMTDRVVIVTAEPGMGKSTILTEVAEWIKSVEPTWWVAKISLSLDCSHMLNMWLKKKKSIDNDAVFEFLRSATKCDSQLEKILFEHCYKKGKIALLLDGYDEINPDYTSQVTHLLNVLKHTKVGKLWITTRPYNIDKKLEETLNSFSYTLQGFTQEDRKSFLKKFWDQKLHFYIEQLLQNFGKLMVDGGNHFFRIPLHLQMIADVIKDTYEDLSESSMDQLSHEQLSNNFRQKLDLVSIYGTFFDKKIMISLRKGQPNTNFKNPANKKILNSQAETLKKSHAKLALHNLYGNDLAEQLTHENIGSELLQDIMQGEETTGIIYRVDEEKVVFVHQSYAEYFAALWFAENWQKETQNVKLFLKEHIFKSGNELTLRFLDLMIAKGNCSYNDNIHIAVLNNDNDAVSRLLEDKTDTVFRLDKAQRTPLHLAASYNNRKITGILLRAAQRNGGPNILSMRDDLFGWRPLSYADKNQNWNIVELMLQKGADGDDMFEAVRSIDERSHENITEEYGYEYGWKLHYSVRWSLLHLAASRGYLEIIKYLVAEKNAKFEAVDANQRTPLHLAAQEGHLEIIKYLVDQKEADFEAVDTVKLTPLHLAAQEGHLEIIKYLVDQKEANFEAVDEYQRTPLHFAARDGHLEIIKYLVDQKGADFEAVGTGKITPLFLAAAQGHLEIIKYLVAEKNAKFEAVDANQRTPLHFAAQEGHLEIIKYLVDQKEADFEAVDTVKLTPLHFAAAQGHLEIIKYLVAEKNAKFEALAVEKLTPLHVAAQEGHLEIIKYLVDQKEADFEAVDTKKFTPLHFAAAQGHLEIIKYLVAEKNAKLEALAVEKITPLHLAAQEGHLEIIKYLVDQKGANFEAVNEYQRTPLHFAARDGHLEIIKYLVDQKGADFEAVGTEKITPLFLAAAQGHLEIIKYLVAEKNAKFEAVDANQRTPLHLAAMRGHLEIIKYLVAEKNAKFEALADKKITPLHLAAQEGHLEIIKYLVAEKNAKFEAVDVNQWTPLHLAAQEGHLEIIKYLVDQKEADFEAVDTKKLTPLHLAAMQGHLEIIKYLVAEKNAKFEALAVEKITPLHLAAQEGHLEIIKYLVDQKEANFEAVEENQRTPLHFAARGGHLEIIKYLVDQKEADFEAVDTEKLTPLHLAAIRGHLKIIKYLVAEKNAKFEAVDEIQRTPLHFAAWGDHLEIIKYLVDQKEADFEAVDIEKLTPLHLAAQEGRLGIIKYLVAEKNAKFEAVDANQRTPLHLAAAQGHLEIIKYLVAEKNAKFEAVDANQRTPLHLAAAQGHLEIIKYLGAEKNANFWAVDVYGTTPVHLWLMRAT